MSAIISFFLWSLEKVKNVISGIPGKIAVLVAGLSAVVAECVSFVDSLASFFTDKSVLLQQFFLQFVDSFDGSELVGLLVYCSALDVLVTIVSDVVGFLALVLTFVFVSFVHVVLIFFGLRYGYHVYKYMATAFSNGIAKT